MFYVWAYCIYVLCLCFHWVFTPKAKATAAVAEEAVQEPPRKRGRQGQGDKEVQKNSKGPTKKQLQNFALKYLEKVITAKPKSAL